MKGTVAIMTKMYTYPTERRTINVNALKANSSRRLAAGLIEPAREDSAAELAPEHAASPIKSLDEIERVSDYFINNGRYRDNMLFIVGINVGLRVSDLRMLRFCDLIDADFTFKDSFPVFEKKTRNTRKRKKNRYIAINDAVMDAVTLYLEHTDGISLSDYMFRSESNHGGNLNAPLSIKSIDRILKNAAKECEVTAKMSTHTLRKTFAYWTMVFGGNDQRQLLLLQKMFNHSSPAQTLTYIGLDRDEMDAAYKRLNLGGKNHRRLVGASIYEDAKAV